MTIKNMKKKKKFVILVDDLIDIINFKKIIK